MAKFIIYADDTSLFLCGKSALELQVKGSAILEKLLHWSNVNSLKINIAKSEALIFLSVNRTVSTARPITVGTNVIEILKKHKRLGIVFEEHLKWSEHILHLTQKLSKMVGVLCRCRDILPVEIKK